MRDMFALPRINSQKAATCAQLFAPIKGPVCAKGVRAAPCKNAKKWLCRFFDTLRQHGKPGCLFAQRGERKRTFDGTEEQKKADKEEYDRRIAESIKKEERMPGREYSTFTQTENKDNIIARLESELSNVQAKKTKAIEALSKYRMEKARLDSENAGNDAVDDWIAAVLGEDVSENG